MCVRWTTDAADDLERICDYIAQSSPESARRVAQSVVERIGTSAPAIPDVDRCQSFRYSMSGRYRGLTQLLSKNSCAQIGQRERASRAGTPDDRRY